MRMKLGVYFLVALIILSLVFGIYSLTYPDIKTKLMPSIFSGIVCVLAVVQLGRELLAGRRTGGVETATKTEKIERRTGNKLHGSLMGFAWLAGIILSIYLIGFLISISLFVFVYLKAKRKGWLMSAAQAAVAVLLAYLFFVSVLGVDLYPGLLFGGH